MTQKHSPEDPQISFEKYKLKVELFKWFIGSVALVLVTTVIDYGFRDRAAGLEEMQQYDKYITDLIVLNKEPGQRRMLAQFFANVTPSEKLRKGWADYYREVDKEYQLFIAPVLKNDSLVKKEYDSIILHKDTTNVVQKARLMLLKTKMEDNERLINPDIILPSKAGNKDYNAALDWELKGFNYLLAKDVENATMAFRNSEDAYNTFHSVYEIANYLTAKQAVLKDAGSPAWKEAFMYIANQLSWEMPDGMRKKLQDAQ